MSGAGKNIAKAVSKGIDWDHIARAVVSEEGRRELFMLRRSFDDVSNTLETKFNTKEVKIDWKFYEEKLGPKIVGTFKSSFDTLEIPEYDDTHTPEYKKKYEEMMKTATQLEEESKREVVRLNAEIEKIKQEKEGLRTVTVDDYFQRNPKVKEEIDDEIRNQNWG